VIFGSAMTGLETATRSMPTPQIPLELGGAEINGDCMIVGSGMSGLGTAEVVMKTGHQATIANMLPEIGAGARMAVILDLKQRMAPDHSSYIPGHKLVKITTDGVELESLKIGSAICVPARTVILALGVCPRKNVVDCFKAAFPDARVIGDAARAGRVIDATQDGYGQAFVFET